MRAWRSDGRGDLWVSGQTDALTDTFSTSDDGLPDNPVLIAVESASIATADIKLINRANLDNVRPPFTPGFEIAGVVLHSSDLQRGTRVVGTTALGTGAWAERAVAERQRLMKVPEGISAADALALYVPGQTAGLAVWQRARVAPGETVVVHDPMSSIGALALQLAAGSGAKVIAVAEAALEHRLVDLGAHDFVDINDSEWSTYIRRQYRTVDVVIDLLQATPVKAATELLGFDGRLVVGKASTAEQAVDTAELAKRCGHVLGVSWGAYERFRPDVLRTISARLFELVRRSHLNPAIDRHVVFDKVGDTVAELSGDVTRTVLVDMDGVAEDHEHRQK